jgi:hypothetical protein
MPFYREWDVDTNDYIINRNRTGPPEPPDTGTTVESGAVVADSSTVTVRPNKTIKVTIPGPREPVLNASGIMAPRWRRFFEELYRRTGALEDNVNKLTIDASGESSLPDDLVLAGQIPTLTQDRVAAPSTASITITGELADRTVA